MQLFLKHFIFPPPTCNVPSSTPSSTNSEIAHNTVYHFSHKNSSFKLQYLMPPPSPLPTEKKLTKCHFFRNDFLFLLPYVMFLRPPFTSQSEKGSIYPFMAPISLFYPPWGIKAHKLPAVHLSSSHMWFPPQPPLPPPPATLTKG